VPAQELRISGPILHSSPSDDERLLQERVEKADPSSVGTERFRTFPARPTCRTSVGRSCWV